MEQNKALALRSKDACSVQRRMQVTERKHSSTKLPESVLLQNQGGKMHLLLLLVNMALEWPLNCYLFDFFAFYSKHFLKTHLQRH